MATRNILDSLGNVVGSLTLPDTTSEQDWQAALSPYAAVNVAVPINAPLIKTTNITGSGAVTTSSGTASIIGNMSITPDAGTYLAEFNGGIYTGGASATGEFGIYIDGVLIAETRRDISCNLTLLGGLVTVSLNSIGVGTNTATQVTLNGTQAIEVRFRSTNGGIIGFNERVFTLIRVR